MHGENSGESTLRLLAALFVVAICIPLMVTVLRPDAPTSGAEKRRLSPLPEIPQTIAGWRTYPDRFNRYYGDHFGIREPLTLLYSRVKVGWLGVSPNSQVVIGRSGWLYYGDEAMDGYRGAAPFLQRDLIAFQQILEGKRDWLAARGIRYLFVVAPDKQTIYPEYIPRRHRRIGPTPMDQLVAHLKARSNVDILDLRPTLTAAKSLGMLYPKTDSHWNDLGAYVAYQAILDRLRDWFPSIGPHLETAGTVTQQRTDGDLAYLMGVGDLFPDSRVGLRINHKKCARKTAAPIPGVHRWQAFERPFRMHCKSGAPVRIAMLRDSMGSQLIPFLAEHFSHSTYVRQAAYSNPLDNPFPVFSRMVRSARPHVVIDELAERSLRWSQRLAPEFARASLAKKTAGGG